MTIEQRQTSPLVLKDMPGQAQQPSQWVFRVAALSIVIVLLGGCMALLWQMQQGSSASHAVPAIPVMPADVSVVGPPSLSAATVNAIFSQVGSPMAGTGATIETLSRQYNIDDAFALGVWWTETNDGMAGVGSADRNPGSVRGSPGYPSAWDGYTIYPSYTAAISDWFSILNGRYIRSGLTTVFSIARPYVGTSSYPLWAGKVIALIYRYRGIAPPPPPVTPTPKPKPKPKPVPTLSPAMVVQQHRLATLLPREADFAYVRARQGLDTETAHSAPAQIAPPVVPVATTQPASLSPTLLYIIIFSGLLAALLIALYARSIGSAGRGIPARAATASEPITAPQRIAILSPLETEAALVLAGATPSSHQLPRQAIPMLSLPALETTTEALQPLPASSITPGRQFTPPSPRPIYLPARPRQTDALPRRTLIIPPLSDSRMPVTVGVSTERSAGLLSRYRERQEALQ